MDIRVEKSSELTHEVSIEITKEDYSEKVETALKKQKRNAIIPGFRPGNAPMGMIKKMYEKGLIVDEIDKILSESIHKYIEENELKTIGNPLPLDEKTKMDIDNREEPFVFAFEIGLEPQFEINYEELPTLPYFEIEASEEEIDNYIQELRRKFGQYTNPDEIAEGDFISVKHNEKDRLLIFDKLSKTGKELFLGKKINDELTVDLTQLFEVKKELAQFLDVKEEELPEKMNDTVLKIINIIRNTLAEINEEFFNKAFPNQSIKTEEELKGLAATEIEKQWATHRDRIFMTDCINLLLDNLQINLPEDFLKRTILLGNKELTPEKIEQEFDGYKRSFKWQLIENKIVIDNKIHVSHEEIKDFVRDFYIKNYFSNFNLEEAKEQIDTIVQNALQKQEDVKNIYDQLYDQKIMEVLVKNMKLDKKSGTFQDFIEAKNKKEEDEKGNKKESKASKATATKATKTTKSTTAKATTKSTPKTTAKTTKATKKDVENDKPEN